MMRDSNRVFGEIVSRARWLALLFAVLLPAPAFAAERFTVVNFNLRLAATDVKAPDGSTLPPVDGLIKVAEYLAEHTRGAQSAVGLQEVDEIALRSGCLAQASTLAWLLGGDWTGVFSNTYTTTRDRCAGLPLAQRGNAMLSDVPIEKLQEYKYIFPAAAPLNDRGRFQRGGTSVKLALPGGRKLWFVNTHLDGVGAGQVAMQQIFELLGKVKRFDPDFPVVLVGDLNIKASSPGSAFRKHYDRLQALTASALFENAFPDIQNDGVRMHVYVYDPHDLLSVVSAEVLDPVLHRPEGDYVVSDHDVLRVTFDYR